MDRRNSYAWRSTDGGGYFMRYHGSGFSLDQDERSSLLFFCMYPKYLSIYGWMPCHETYFVIPSQTSTGTGKLRILSALSCEYLGSVTTGRRVESVTTSPSLVI